MIQIYRDFDDLAEWHYDNLTKHFRIDALLDAEITNNGSDIDNFLIFLKSNLKDILKGNPLVLEKKIMKKTNEILGDNYFTEKSPNLKVRGPKPRLNIQFINKLNSIFNYDEFCDSFCNYNAYLLAEKLEINVCPYCNRNYISTLKPVKNKRKTLESGTRPTLDHYYLKSDFPYLALSFWNLIPSCYSCNSQLRGTKSFSAFNNIHPYLNSFENYLYFQTDIKDITEFIGNSNQIFSIDLNKSLKSTNNSFKLFKANNNNTVFKIKEIYNNNHKTEVREIIQKALIYNKSYSKSLFESYNDVFTDENDAKKMMLGNYVLAKDFEKRPLSKLTRDIADELGLI